MDPIESALLRARLTRSFETGLAAYLVAETLADASLSQGHSATVDAVNAVEPAKELWRSLAARHAQPLRILECVCSDETVHRARVQSRRRNLAIPEPAWPDVLARRAEWTPWKEPRLLVDSAADHESNVASVLAWLEAK